MSLHVTSLLAGLFSVLMVLLSFQVSLRRVKAGVATFDDGNDETLRRRIRAHGNFIEYAPTALIAVGLIEYASGTGTFVWCLAAAFFVSRALHAVGILFTSTPILRAMAMLIQHAAFLIAGVWLITKAM